MSKPGESNALAIVRQGILRRELNSPIISPDGLFIATKLIKGQALVVISERIVRRQLNGLVYVCQGLLVATDGIQRGAHFLISRGFVWIQFDRWLKKSERFF